MHKIHEFLVTHYFRKNYNHSNYLICNMHKTGNISNGDFFKKFSYVFKKTIWIFFPHADFYEKIILLQFEFLASKLDFKIIPWPIFIRLFIKFEITIQLMVQINDIIIRYEKSRLIFTSSVSFSEHYPTLHRKSHFFHCFYIYAISIDNPYRANNCIHARMTSAQMKI